MILDKLETQAVDFVARFSPWLAPLPTAYLTATATVEHLAWPLVIGVIAGAIVEALGLASIATALTLREYNATKRKSDPLAPCLLAVSLAAVYFVAVTFLTVALDTAPNLAMFAPLVFPIMSIAGATVLAIRADHKRRLAVIADEKAERIAKRQEKRNVVPIKRKKPESGARRVQVLALIAQGQYQSSEKLAPTFGVSPQTIRNDVRLLAQAGEIERQGNRWVAATNGSGGAEG